ncbi:hypothetical protein GCM10010441_67990 [Kitasatospora paracochleata]
MRLKVWLSQLQSWPGLISVTGLWLDRRLTLGVGVGEGVSAAGSTLGSGDGDRAGDSVGDAEGARPVGPTRGRPHRKDQWAAASQLAPTPTETSSGARSG